MPIPHHCLPDRVTMFSFLTDNVSVPRKSVEMGDDGMVWYVVHWCIERDLGRVQATLDPRNPLDRGKRARRKGRAMIK